MGSIDVVTASSLPGRRCLDASRWSSFPVPVCFLMVPMCKQRIPGSFLVVRVPFFPATLRLLPGTRCGVIEAVCNLSTSRCGLTDASLGIQGTRSKHPGTLGCFTASVPKPPASTGELPNPMGLLRYTGNALPWTLRLCARTGRFLVGAFRFQSGQGNQDRVSGCEGTVRATGFVGTISNFPEQWSRDQYVRSFVLASHF